MDFLNFHDSLLHVAKNIPGRTVFFAKQQYIDVYSVFFEITDNILYIMDNEFCSLDISLYNNIKNFLQRKNTYLYYIHTDVFDEKNIIYDLFVRYKQKVTFKKSEIIITCDNNPVNMIYNEKAYSIIGNKYSYVDFNCNDKITRIIDKIKNG